MVYVDGTTGTVNFRATASGQTLTINSAGKLLNVTAGTLSSTSKDAVNGSQLYAVAQQITNMAGSVDAVQYDSAAHSAVTLGGLSAKKGVALHNVANGTLNAASLDAVNGSQLFATNQTVSTLSGNVTDIYGKIGNAVQYDSSAHTAVTLGGSGTKKGVALLNVANGTLSAASLDAVNGSQLFATNQNVSTLSGNVTDIYGKIGNAVQYDSSAHTAVTLGGSGTKKGVALLNVANGTLSAASLDAVNGSQLFATNQTVSTLSGNVTDIYGKIGNAVQYDSSAHTAVTLGGSGTKKGVALLNVANGTLNAASLDAVNGSQLFATNQNVSTLTGNVTDIYGKLGDAVMYDSSAHTAVTLGGSGAKKGVALHNVANGTLGAASLDAVNGSQLFAANQNISTLSGNVTDIYGKLGNAVMYDSAAHNAVTLGGVGTTSPVALHNVAEGSADTDAVNVAQMKQAVINPYIAGSGTGNPAQSSAPGAVALGLDSVASVPYTISVGNDASGLTRRITNVASGFADTDAVNVSQLNSKVGATQANMLQSIDQVSADTKTALSSVNNTLAAINTQTQQNALNIAALEDGLSNASTGSNATAASGARMVAATRTLVGVSAVSDAATPSSTSTDPDALHYDSADHSSVTLSSTSGANVSLSGLQNGALSANSTDAVTGQQLYATNQQVASINQAVQNISLTGSTAVSANTTSGVAAASGAQSLAVGGGAVVTGANSTALGDKANASANNAVAIGANSVANRDNAVSVGQEGAERQIVNVAAGTSGTDAVNLNQLNNAMAQQSTAFGQQIASLQGQVNTVSKNAYAGVAAAMAMPNLTPSGPGRTVVAAGGGYYMGGSAGAVGVTYRSTNMRWLVNGAVSVTSTGTAAVRTQVGYEF
ncbi:YadA-like family protein [Burkholderia sp. Ax-1719]|uniref:YadA family autotransporter adhesin n=1 Tax=Burkholderia sp. Ax-1719 TaxID=2608334 RepID=UPI0023DC83F4|nr:YadA-like family protein [Burkholderia sp. Ax-1719]